MDPVTSRTRHKNRIFTLVMILTSLLLSVLLAEVVLRIKERAALIHPPRPAGWAIIPEKSWIQHDSEVGWISKKNISSELDKNGTTIPIHTNSLGLRGTREYSEKKPAGVTRIYAIGDSFTFGFGVEDQNSFPAQMESQAPGLEVMNWGVPGYGVDQVYALLKKTGFSYQPDIVLMTLFPEDFWRTTRAFNDAGNGKPYFVLMPDQTLQLRHVPVPPDKDFSVPQFPVILQENTLERILNHSAFCRFLKKASEVLKKKWGFEDPDTTAEWLLGRAILKEMVVFIRSHGAHPVIVIAPPKRWITGTTEPIRESLVRFAQRENILLIDLTPEFLRLTKGKSADLFYILNDDHWTAEGNRTAAKTILKVLKKESLIP